jgi:hypothetical protein
MLTIYNIIRVFIKSACFKMNDRSWTPAVQTLENLVLQGLLERFLKKSNL